jgi:hypothetical protein
MTAIICPLARLLADGASKFEGAWQIPVPRNGWRTWVTVSIKLADEKLHVSISAFGRRPDDRHERCLGCVYYPAFFGNAPRSSITADWIDGVLAREIETAMIAARSFRDEDFSEEDLPEHYKHPEFYEGMAGYFASTLERCGK